MAIGLFKVIGGFTDGAVSYLSGAGLPSGADADLAGRGSYWTDTLTGDKYSKTVAGAGAANWVKMATAADIAGLPNADSWREPVVALDNVTTSVTAALTAINTSNAVDGVAIAAGDRVLFTAFAAPDNANVYIVGGSTGAWTLTEDTNLATQGDRLSVLNGTFAGQEWLYSNNNAWLWIGERNAAEEAAIRAFIGKAAAGTELPAYTSTVYVTNGNSLESAIGQLDAALATLASSVTTNSTAITQNQSDIAGILAGSGLGAAGAYVANSAATYISTATSLFNADVLLDAALAAVDTKLSSVVTGVGLNADGTFPTLAGTNYLSTATSVVSSLQLLDTALAATDANVTSLTTKVGSATWLGTSYVDGATNLTDAITLLDAAINNAVATASVTTAATNITLDNVPVDAISMASWKVVVEDAATPSNRTGFTVDVIHNGTTIADATALDPTSYGKMEVGADIPSLNYDVVLSGTGAAQTMQLSITAGVPVIARCKRLSV